MNTYADKTQEKKSQSISNAVSQKHRNGKSTFQFVDNRPEAIAQRKLQEMANNSPQMKQAAQLQSMADNHSAKKQRPIQKKENYTGLPDNLKSGIENLSGYSMDDVKVHYNSDKPAQLQAHAYAQGSDIHLASGQEKHLPHEAWHVVQQKQGRVKPTMQMKGKVKLNDDAGLEKEADVMGDALQKKSNHTHEKNSHAKVSSTNTNNVKVKQLKRKGEVDQGTIDNALTSVEDDDLKRQLENAWFLIIRSGGEAYFDDEINKSFAGWDPQKNKLVLSIPESSFFQWADTSLEKKAIIIHELTHVAEIASNTGNLYNMNYDMSTPEMMETDIIKSEKLIEKLFDLLEKEKELFKSVQFNSSTGHEMNLYGFAAERLGYAGIVLQNRNTNYEFPTVINQLVYVLNAKDNGHIKASETYTWLKVIEKLMIDSRDFRKNKNINPAIKAALSKID